MKTLVKILLVTILTLTISNGFSIVPDTTSTAKMPEVVKKTMTRQMQFPVEASKQKIEGEVAICFTITDEGKVIVNCINGHPVLKKAVQQKLSELTFPQHLTCANKNMFIKYKFDIEGV